MSHFKNIYKLIWVLLAGFLGGFFAFIVINTFNQKTSTQETIISNPTKTSKVTYKNTTNTTKAVKVIQNAVVSVLNYQAVDTNTSNPASQLFGQENDLKKDDGLSLFSEGSGVIYKKDDKSAYLVTNNHVIDGAKRIEILLADGSKVVGKLVGSDTYSDLAVVKISADKIKSIGEFADSTKINVGEVAIAIGSPLGSEYANSVTEGIVSSLSRTVTLKNEEGQTVSTNALQTDAAINPGNSGGPLINIEGQIIGINSSKISSGSNGGAVEGMGFAIPSNDVLKIINQLEGKGEVIRPALGISMVNLGDLSTNAISQLKIPKDLTGGIVVASVKEGMPASGKLEQYDIITEINGKAVTTTSDLQSELYGHNIDDSIKITFYRGKDKKTDTIKLTKTTKDLEK
ncbi:S1C family serine protease [Streptococcus iniae]|uniref:S1C family serine protease n=1 Tax=Streptococcus iniae TaxID=1346 RepID=UPI000334809F|nr:S1C family serine protease [Streptococcus iniae]AGM99953.1 serine protease do-like HtrA [Streptococcus iniae SF1]APD32816.1 serine protease [Streptococcus iniae]AYB01907.1 serine protease [Streptococcus iniae]AYB03607.1 serine protease [Streptococcus iniae]OAS95999.1 serine protease [Streptococcus iniae]